MKIHQTHFSKNGVISACGSSRNSNWFTATPDKVTCKRCQTTYDYLETVDALTRPDGEGPRYTRPVYAKTKLLEYPEGSSQYDEAVKEIVEDTTRSALKNAARQATEQVLEDEVMYEISYTVTGQKVRQSDLLDVMQTLIRAKATNLRLIQKAE